MTMFGLASAAATQGARRMPKTAMATTRDLMEVISALGSGIAGAARAAAGVRSLAFPGPLFHQGDVLLGSGIALATGRIIAAIGRVVADALEQTGDEWHVGQEMDPFRAHSAPVMVG